MVNSIYTSMNDTSDKIRTHLLVSFLFFGALSFGVVVGTAIRLSLFA